MLTQLELNRYLYRHGGDPHHCLRRNSYPYGPGWNRSRRDHSIRIVNAVPRSKGATKNVNTRGEMN